MRLLDIASLSNLLALVICSPNEQRQDKNSSGGYLAAIFKGDEPSVFFYLASADEPTSFKALNGGAATLVPTLGTGGARDPYILKTESKQYYVLATDLDIGKTDWSTAQTNGSRSIYVWDSVDGLKWSKERLVELMPPTAGYVWAPSAIWDVQASQYAVFWSSVAFSEDDTAHTDTPQGSFIYYSHTSDFATFTEAARWEPNNNATVIDQEIQYLDNQSYIRYLSDTAITKRVVVDRSDNGLFGTWTRIGVPVDALREGPASFQDIENPARYYLWEDNYNGSGYECYWTEHFQVPYQACDPPLAPAGMRHGGVVQVEQSVYDALNAR